MARVGLAERTEPLPRMWQRTVPKPTPLTLTWVLATTTPLDEADDEQNQHQEGDGTHEPDEPALGGDVSLVVGVSWGRGTSKHVKGFTWGMVRRETGGKSLGYFTSMFLLKPMLPPSSPLAQTARYSDKEKIMKEPRSKVRKEAEEGGTGSRISRPVRKGKFP